MLLDGSFPAGLRWHTYPPEMDGTIIILGVKRHET